jgi:Family of unknown function (DUF6326)
LEDWKIKISVLWLFTAVAFVAYVVLGMLEPGAIQEIMSGTLGGIQIGSGWLLFLAVVILAPLVMAFLSIVLKGSANLWANGVVGILLIIFELIVLTNDVLRLSPGLSLMTIAKIAAIITVIWYAWKSKQKA